MIRNDCVKPLRAYAAPAYPTGMEIGHVDLSLVPVRWRRLRTVASTLGAAAMSLKALALETQEAPKPVASAPVVAVPDAETPKAVAQKPVTDVCPLPAKEIAGDGEGAFGCVAMNPPVILPEGEALDIIEREFAKRGVTLVDCPVLEGVELPDPDWYPSNDELRHLERVAKNTGVPIQVPRKKRRLQLDFGTPDGAVLVDYLSVADSWKESVRADSTFAFLGPRAVAQERASGLRARTTHSSVTVGLFYDPCATLPLDWKPILPADVQPDTPRANRIWYEQREAMGKKIAREKLVAQIEHFFDYLAKRPVK